MAGTDGADAQSQRGHAVLAGRYALGEALGRGGMATVYRARDTKLERDVAVKVFSSSTVEAQDGERRLREIRLLASVAHPHLVTLFDAEWQSETDATPSFLVMELVEGESMRRRLDRLGPDPALARRALAELAEALDYLHGRGVIHRDVKPENVLIDGGSGRLKLVDFGIAQLVGAETLTATGTVLGTAAYLSPEQVAGEPVGGASDIYSLGLVVLETLTGERAFPGASVESAIARLSRDPLVSHELPADWRELLAAMLARDPAGRPSAASVAARASELNAAVAAPAAPEAPVVAWTEAQTAAVTGPTRVYPSEAPTARIAGDGAGESTARTEVMAAGEGGRSTPPAPPLGGPLRARAPRARGRAILIAAVAAAIILIGGVVGIALESAHRDAGGATQSPRPATQTATPQPTISVSVEPASAPPVAPPGPGKGKQKQKPKGHGHGG